MLLSTRHPKDESKREKSAVYKSRCENQPARPISGRTIRKLNLCIRAWPQLALIAVTLPDLGAIQVASALRQFPETADMVLIATAGAGATSILEGCYDNLFDGQIAHSGEQMQSSLQTIITNSRVSRSTRTRPQNDVAQQVSLASASPTYFQVSPSKVKVTKVLRKKVSITSKSLTQLPNGVSFARWGTEGPWTAIPSVMAEKLRTAGAHVIGAH